MGVDVAPLSIIRMLWKRKVIILSIWIVATVATYFAVRRIPAIYSASALIVIDSQKIPEKFVSATVNVDVQERFAAITQRILSTAQLKKIIQQYDLYKEARKTHFEEEVIALMRNDISILPGANVAGVRPGAFRIAYQGPDPVAVAQVANQIANLYIEENLRTREVQAEGTSEFIEAQLREAKEKLDSLEASVSSYKVRFNGELPQQEGSLNAVLNRLQVELEANRDAMNRAHVTKVTLENSVAMTEDALANQSRPGAQPNISTLVADTTRAAVAEPVIRRKSETLRADLDTLRSRYSDEHPDVIKAKAAYERALESEAAEPPRPVIAAAKPGASPAPVAAVRDNATVQALRERLMTTKSQLAEVNREIESRQAQQKRILSDIGSQQSRVTRIPIREQEMSQLTRDYEIAKLHYRSLLEKKISADMASDMEKRQKAERFALADPARTPERPIKPKRMLILGIGSFIGLFAGLVLGIGKEVRDGCLLGEWQLPAGVPVIARLPVITHSSLEPETASRKRSFFRRAAALVPFAAHYLARCLSGQSSV